MVALNLTPLDFFSRIGWHPAPLVVILALAGAYNLGVRRYNADATTEATTEATGGTTTTAAGGPTEGGRPPWPIERSASFVLALLILAAATLSGLASYLTTSFSVTAVAQLGIFMLAPLFLALSAPITLALETLPSALAERIRRAVTSPVTRILSVPALTFSVYAAAVSLLYFSGQYRFLVEHRWAVPLTDLELLVVGCAFVWPVIGADPRPRQLAVGWRILYVLLCSVFYSVVGLAMESQRTPVGPNLTVSDFHTGAGVMFSTGELLTIAMTIGILIRWLTVDLGHAQRADRYNAAEDATQLALWRAQRRSAALADVRVDQSLNVRSRPAGTESSDRSASLARTTRVGNELSAPAAEDDRSENGATK